LNAGIRRCNGGGKLFANFAARSALQIATTNKADLLAQLFFLLIDILFY
jgi:hypothetical protein